MAQQIIDVGSVANDGTGDPLRTAYQKINDNFTEVFNTSNIANGSSSITVAQNGNISMTANGVANVMVVSSSGVSIIGDLAVTGNAVLSGNILGDRIVNGTTSIDIQSPGGNANISIGGVTNVGVFSPTGLRINGAISAAGNVTGGYILGNGSQLTGIGASYSNADVTTLLADFGSNSISTTGNIAGSYILGDGSLLTGIGAAYSNADVTTLLASFGSNSISTTGNISGGYFLGNGSQLTGLPATYSNANVTSLLASFGSNTVSTSGNITGGYILGDGSQLTGLPANYGNTNVAAYLAAFGSNSLSTAGSVTAASVIGGVVAGTTVSVTGNVTGGNVNTGGRISAAGTITGSSLLGSVVSVSGNVTAGNVNFGAGAISGTGNITAGYFFGDGSGLVNVGAGNYGNANVADYLPTYSGNLQNITVTGTTTAVGNVDANTINGQLKGTVNGLNPTYGTWDFGNINGTTFDNPIAWIFSVTPAGNIDMGTVTAPASLEIDIGTIL